MTPHQHALQWFTSARYGMFVHYGLYSLLSRGEWAMNREQIPPPEYARLAHRFTAERFDAESLCDLAVRGGMRYIVFTTMHHDGFRLYHSDLTDHCVTNSPARRDLTAEMIAAARSRGLRIGLYHSLNNWHDRPDATDALEDSAAYDRFIAKTHARIEELLRRYNPVDILWYDGWWPYGAKGWQAHRMHEMVRTIQPHILVNNRNGLAGDFGTPEQHATAPHPWRPWEACLTLNNSWGYHAGDHDWKTPQQVIDLLATVAAGQGNLLLNVGPSGDGSIPEPSEQIITSVGEWLATNHESIYDTDLFTMHQHADWCHHGPFTARGNNLYLILRRSPGREVAIGGLNAKVQRVTLLHADRQLPFEQALGRVNITLPEAPPKSLCPVIRFECESSPSLYLTAGMRVPRPPHPRYDPLPDS